QVTGHLGVPIHTQVRRGEAGLAGPAAAGAVAHHVPEHLGVAIDVDAATADLADHLDVPEIDVGEGLDRVAHADGGGAAVVRGQRPVDAVAVPHVHGRAVHGPEGGVDA